MWRSLQSLFVLLSSARASGVTVETSFGKLIGNTKDFFGCEEFLGIPFAQAPIGAKRFEDPVPWDKAYPADGRHATSFGEGCPQMGSGNEDCLFLNLWRPAKPSKGSQEAPLAVLVFIHGGGWISGSSSASILGPVPAALNLYDGCGFVARQGVMVVTLNYRLGPLGFTAFREDGRFAGNFAMKDQRQALLWLRQELRAFGGDPSKVTIFGESSGGMSVFYHVASPKSKGLFRAAVSESGFPTAWSWEKGHNTTLAFAMKLGCHEPGNLKACLRKLPAKELIGNETVATNPFAFPTASPPWQPVVDGSDMPKYPMTLFKEKRTNVVPMLAGYNTDEANLFVWPFYEKGMNKSQFSDFFAQGVVANYVPLQFLSSAEMADVFSAYQGADFDSDDKRALASRITTDISFQCGTHASGQEYTVSDFWLYRFNHRSACQFWLKGLVPGVYHTSELQYVWHVQAKLACVLTPQESELSKRMQTMWANFAKCLDPTCGADGFPKYTNSSRKALIFQTPADTVEEDYSRDRCALWDRLVFEKYRGQTGGPSVFKEVLV